MKFQISVINNLKVLSFSITTIFICLIAAYFLNLKTFGVVYGLSVYLVFCLPSFYVHIIYYLENRCQTILIDVDEVTLIQNGNEIIKYNSTELLKVIIYKPATLDKESYGLQFTPFESYNYARIIPIKGKEIVFTCLLLPDVEKAVKIIKGVTFERRKGLFFTIERPNKFDVDQKK